MSGQSFLSNPGAFLRRSFSTFSTKSLFAVSSFNAFQRYRKKLFPHSEEATKGQYRITHIAIKHVQHNFLDFTQVFIFPVIDLISNKGVSAHPFDDSAITLINCLHTNWICLYRSVGCA